MSVNFAQLFKRLPQNIIQCSSVTSEYIYHKIKFIHKEEALDNRCVYIGKSSHLPLSGWQDFEVGFFIVNDAGLDFAALSVDYAELNPSVNLVRLYEEFKEVNYHDALDTAMNIFGDMVASKDINYILRRASQIIVNPILVINEQYRLLAYCCDQTVDDPVVNYILEHGHVSAKHLQDSRLENHFRDVRNSHVPTLIGPGGEKTHKRIVQMFRVNGKERCSILVLEHNRPISPADYSIVSALGNVLVHAVKQQNNFGKPFGVTDYMYQNHLIDLLQGKSYDSSWVTGFLKHMHWSSKPNYFVFVLLSKLGIYETPEMIKLCQKLHEAVDCYIFPYEHKLIMICNIPNSECLLKTCGQVESLLKGQDLQAGFSEHFKDIKKLHEYYRQAEDAIKINAILRKQNTVCYYAEVIVYDLLLKLKEQASIDESFIDQRLDTLLLYDKDHHTDYYGTLKEFLKSACNRTLTASRLYIHRNTLIYRLKKIAEILPADLSNGEECLRLFLAYKFRDLDRDHSE